MVSTRKRPTLLNTLLIVASLLLVGLMLANPASAEPRKTTSSMSSRVTSQRELCETLGGGQMDYVNSYEGGKLVGVTTYCKGGKGDGYNCANTATTYDCWQSPKSGSAPRRPGLADPITEVQVVQATPVGNLPSVGSGVSDGGPQRDIGNVDAEPDLPVLTGDSVGGQPADGSIVGSPIENPNTITDNPPIVLQELTPEPTSTP
jgi:hypothetical protein